MTRMMMTRGCVPLLATWWLSMLPLNWCFVSVLPPPSILSKKTRVNHENGNRLAPLYAVGLSFEQLNDDNNNNKNDELYYRYVVAKAKEVAYSDSSSAIDARHFLNRILELESRCVGGLIAGYDLCDNVDEMADVVSHLRQRVEVGQRLHEDSINHQKRSGAAASLVAVSLFPVSLLAFLLAMVIVSTIDWRTGAVPFTVDEWIMATRGGYLHTMIDHYIRNGGL